MIKFQDMTPLVYYRKSRDFQFIGRLFDLVLNYTKTNVDLINNIPLNDNSDQELIDLVAMTLGFKSKHNYNTAQLIALCSAFTTILRYKGTKKAIELACTTLFNAEGINAEPSVEVTNQTITIAVPNELSDLNLLKDLLNYIVPAGMSCEIIRAVKVKDSAATTLQFKSTIEWVKQGPATTEKPNPSIIIDKSTAANSSFIATVGTGESAPRYAGLGYINNTSVNVLNPASTSKKSTSKSDNTKETT